ncbi:hypothetical protein [uncultured Tateyamaria sp.]|uniref:hypothetical protein n=1 Tax=uncultured Tateyamaria sp. TaxID=455651 RepID=UPI0026359C56|nr:hypothetical protein [uncultured Tateyamaria sp.]
MPGLASALAWLAVCIFCCNIWFTTHSIFHSLVTHEKRCGGILGGQHTRTNKERKNDVHAKPSGAELTSARLFWLALTSNAANTLFAPFGTFCAAAPVTSDIAPQLGNVVLRSGKLQKKEKMSEKRRHFQHVNITIRQQMDTMRNRR